MLFVSCFFFPSLRVLADVLIVNVLIQSSGRVRTYVSCPHALVKFIVLSRFTGVSTPPLIHILSRLTIGSKYEHKYRDNWARKLYKKFPIEK